MLDLSHTESLDVRLVNQKSTQFRVKITNIEISDNVQCPCPLLGPAFELYTKWQLQVLASIYIHKWKISFGSSKIVFTNPVTTSISIVFYDGSLRDGSLLEDLSGRDARGGGACGLHWSGGEGLDHSGAHRQGGPGPLQHSSKVRLYSYSRSVFKLYGRVTFRHKLNKLATFQHFYPKATCRGNIKVFLDIRHFLAF